MKKLKWLSENDIKILKKWKTPTATGGKDITTELQDLSERWMNSYNEDRKYCGEFLNKLLRNYDDTCL